jgi:hypothetical protein
MGTSPDEWAHSLRHRLTYGEYCDLVRQEWLQERDSAETEPCEYCAAPVGVSCSNPITGEQLAAPAHWQRIRAHARRVRGRVASRPVEHAPARAA